MKGPLFDEYVEACNYPGIIDDAKITASLTEYCKSLGISREVKRLGPDFMDDDYFISVIMSIADEIAPKVSALAARAALAALAARDALAALDARAALAALAARDALAALDARAARAARAARDARDALDARAARDARDALDARAALAALAALDARAARAARDARDALDARAARDARDALDALDARAALAARAARDARAARAARDARDAIESLKRFSQWCVMSGRYYWWELSWIVTSYFGSEGKPDVAIWSKPLLDAYCGGCWFLFWAEKTLYWIAKPTVIVERIGENRRLHCEDGPACINDIEDLHFWHGIFLPEHAIMHPEKITVQEVRDEQNSETRRAMIERMTPEKYLWETKAELIDVDHEKCRRGASPRALLKDEAGDQWLVGTDGGTKRVYYMPVTREVKTCREAHESICGFDETVILSKS